MNEGFENKAFFITPIKELGSDVRAHSDFMLTTILADVGKKLNLEFVRIDTTNAIVGKLDEVYEHIQKCRIVVADLYTLNPNVLHEIGLAMAWGIAPIILIPDDGETEQPFDLQELSRIAYAKDIMGSTAQHAVKALRDELAEKIRAALDDSSMVTYPRIHMFSKDIIPVSAKLDGIRELLVREKGFNATYIKGENQAFQALTEEIVKARISVKTTRFSGFSVVSSQTAFFKAIKDAPERLEKGLYRIIAANSPVKIKEVQDLILANIGKKLTITLTTKEYNFEIVVVDERVAFVHFRRKDKPQEMISATLKIEEKDAVEEFSEIFEGLSQPSDDLQTEVINCEKIKVGTLPAALKRVTDYFDKNGYPEE